MPIYLDFYSNLQLFQLENTKKLSKKDRIIGHFMQTQALVYRRRQYESLNDQAFSNSFDNQFSRKFKISATVGIAICAILMTLSLVKRQLDLPQKDFINRSAADFNYVNQMPNDHFDESNAKVGVYDNNMHFDITNEATNLENEIQKTPQPLSSTTTKSDLPPTMNKGKVPSSSITKLASWNKIPLPNKPVNVITRSRPNTYPQSIQPRGQRPFSGSLKTSMQKANISQISMKITLQYFDLGYNTPSSELISKQTKYLQQKYHLYDVKEQLPFCVVMLGYNNVEYNRYKLAINSIINQEYSNYHVILIDDFSTDGYGQKAQEYINQKAKYPEKFKVITTKQNNKPMKNHYIASQQYCQQHQLIIIVDGDDALIGTQVLKLFNHQFQKQDVWFAWGNYYATGSDKIGMSGLIKPEIIQRNSYRTQGEWVTSHPKVFYNKLFRNINKTDLSYKQKEFLHAVADRAIVYPIVQMAIDHLLYIPEILYLYVDLTSGAEQFKFGKENRIIVDFLKKKSSYKKLECLFNDQNGKCVKASQYVLSKYK